MIKIVKMVFVTIATICLFSGCTTKIPMKDVTTSKEKFEVTNKDTQIELNLVDDFKNKENPTAYLSRNINIIKGNIMGIKSFITNLQL